MSFRLVKPVDDEFKLPNNLCRLEQGYARNVETKLDSNDDESIISRQPTIQGKVGQQYKIPLIAK